MQNSNSSFTNKFPAVIDLFSGCGGFGLGFIQSGYKLAGSYDLDTSSIRSCNNNLYARYGNRAVHSAFDISKLSLDKIEGDKNGFVVIGGPPCQAYSRVGRGKLRSLGSNRHHLKDSRGMLYEDFLRIALEVNAKAIIMENVPDSTSYGGINIPDTVCDILKNNDYRAHWTILNAADYGVPQIRHRVFVIAVKNN